MTLQKDTRHVNVIYGESRRPLVFIIHLLRIPFYENVIA